MTGGSDQRSFAVSQTAYFADTTATALNLLRLLISQIQARVVADPPPPNCDVGEDCGVLADMADWVAERIEGELAELRKAAAEAGWVKQ